MGLSCDCGYDDAEWFYDYEEDFTKLKTPKRKRCCSCKKLIDIDDTVVTIKRNREPKTNIEQRIFGDGPTVALADWYLCEWCGEMFLNLQSLGYCIDFRDSMETLVGEYQQMTGFKKE